MLYFNVENINNDQDFMKVIQKIRDSLVNLPNKKDKVMVVKITDVVSDDSTMIPKLEFKNS